MPSCCPHAIPETMPWVTESFGSKDGHSDSTNMRRPVRTPGVDTGLEILRPRRRVRSLVTGLCRLTSPNEPCRRRPGRCSVGGAAVFIRTRPFQCFKIEYSHRAKPATREKPAMTRPARTPGRAISAKLWPMVT